MKYYFYLMKHKIIKTYTANQHQNDEENKQFLRHFHNSICNWSHH